MRSQSTRRWTRLLALLLGLAMVAAACGGDDDTAEGGDDGGDGPTDSEPDESEAGDPVPGGKLVYGVEADTSTPWTPANSVCAISCHMICLLYTSPSPRDLSTSRMPSSA